jgi:hypothetical protein
LRHAIAGGTGVTVRVCYGANCTGNTDGAGATNARGTPVTVSVTSTVPAVTGRLLGLSNHTVTGLVTMHVSH